MGARLFDATGPESQIADEQVELRVERAVRLKRRQCLVGLFRASALLEENDAQETPAKETPKETTDDAQPERPYSPAHSGIGNGSLPSKDDSPKRPVPNTI